MNRTTDTGDRAVARAAGPNPADIRVDIAFEDAAGARALVGDAGTHGFPPSVPLVVPFAGGDAFDFEKPTFDIDAPTRLAVVQ